MGEQKNGMHRKLTRYGDEELKRRRAAWAPADEGEALRGYHKLFLDHVTQAGEGCDFDYLTKRPYVARTR